MPGWMLVIHPPGLFSLWVAKMINLLMLMEFLKWGYIIILILVRKIVEPGIDEMTPEKIGEER